MNIRIALSIGVLSAVLACVPAIWAQQSSSPASSSQPSLKTTAESSTGNKEFAPPLETAAYYPMTIVNKSDYLQLTLTRTDYRCMYDTGDTPIIIEPNTTYTFPRGGLEDSNSSNGDGNGYPQHDGDGLICTNRPKYVNWSLSTNDGNINETLVFEHSLQADPRIGDVFFNSWYTSIISNIADSAICGGENCLNKYGKGSEDNIEVTVTFLSDYQLNPLTIDMPPNDDPDNTEYTFTPSGEGQEGSTVTVTVTGCPDPGDPACQPQAQTVTQSTDPDKKKKHHGLWHFHPLRFAFSRVLHPLKIVAEASLDGPKLVGDAAKAVLHIKPDPNTPDNPNNPKDPGDPGDPPDDVNPVSVAITVPVDNTTLKSGEHTFSGTVMEPYAVAIECSVVGGESITVASTGDGGWSCDLNLSDSGQHTVKAVRTPAQPDDIPAENTYTVADPVVTAITSPITTQLQKLGDIEFSGTTTPATDDQIQCYLDGETVGAPVTSKSGLWTCMAPVNSAGEHKVKGVRIPAQTDDESLESEYNFAHPVIITSPKDKELVPSPVTLAGTMQYGATVSYASDTEGCGNGDATTTGNTWKSEPITIPSTSNCVFTATQTLTGKGDMKSEPVTLQISHPVVIKDPADNSTIPNGQAYPISGTGEPGATIAVSLEDGWVLIEDSIVVKEDGTWATTKQGPTGQDVTYVLTARQSKDDADQGVANNTINVSGTGDPALKVTATPAEKE